jgi:hypothetical protein
MLQDNQQANPHKSKAQQAKPSKPSKQGKKNDRQSFTLAQITIKSKASPARPKPCKAKKPLRAYLSVRLRFTVSLVK